MTIYDSIFTKLENALRGLRERVWNPERLLYVTLQAEVFKTHQAAHEEISNGAKKKREEAEEEYGNHGDLQRFVKALETIRSEESDAKLQIDDLQEAIYCLKAIFDEHKKEEKKHE